MKVVFPGSFDPPTNGHLDIMQTGLPACSMSCWMVVADNPMKKYFFSAQERLSMIREMVADCPTCR